MTTNEDRPDAENVEPVEEQIASGAAENDSHDNTIELVAELAAKSVEHRDQAQIAHVFAADHIDELMHVWGLGWYAWTGMRWVEDSGQAQNAVLKTIRKLWAGALDDKALQASLVRNQKASAVNGILTLASRLPGIAAKVEDLDADPYSLNVANGILDLRTLELRPHDPAERHTKITTAAYEPDARSQLWDEFLARVLPDEDARGYLQRFQGSSLIGAVRDHVLSIMTGTGRNGKGVEYGAVMHAMGDYASAGAPGLLEQFRTSPNAPSPGFADLLGRRLVVLSESEEGAALAPALMKRLAGGDPIKARQLHKGLIEFEPSHSVLYVSNFLPKLPPNDPAVWARVRVIPFDVVIPKDEQDPELPDKLKVEADAILTWLVHGLRDYWERGLDEPAAVKVATDNYANSQDDVRRFIDEECVEGADSDTTTTLHNHFRDWAASEGIHKDNVLGKGKFGEALDRLGFSSKKTALGMVRVGLALDRGAAQVTPQDLANYAQELLQAEAKSKADTEVARTEAELAAIEAATLAEREEHRWAHSDEAQRLVAGQAAEPA